MEIKNEIVWVIMSKDRKFIAKGTPRNRHIVEVDNIKDKKRILTYTSKSKAESGFTNYGFYNMTSLTGWDKHNPKNNIKLSQFLEAVECKLILNVI